MTTNSDSYQKKNINERTGLIFILRNPIAKNPFSLLSKIALANPNTILLSHKNKQNWPEVYPNIIAFNNLNKILGSNIQNVIIDLNPFNADYLNAILNTLTDNGRFILILHLNSSVSISYLNYICHEANIAQIPIYNLYELNDSDKVLAVINCFFYPTLFSIQYNTQNTLVPLSSPNNLLITHKEHVNNVIKIVNKSYLITKQSNFINNSFNLLTTSNNKQLIFLMGPRGSGKTTATIHLVSKLLLANVKVGLLNLGSLQLYEAYQNYAQKKHTLSTTLSTITLDNVLDPNNKCDILVVEEAAALPFHKLKPILNIKKHIILVTTIEGYEGSGLKILYELTNGLFSINKAITTFTLNTTFRFNKDDAVAKFLNNICFLTPSAKHIETSLNSKCVNSLQTYNLNVDVKYEVKNLLSLLDQKELLIQINLLLRSNHYEETLQDIIRWINNDSICVLALYQNEILGLAIASLEQIIDTDLAHGIFVGERRPKGNLFPQSLLAHIGLQHITRSSWLRIERIAVKNQVRRQNIGQKLIEKLVSYGIKHGINFLCVVYALNYKVTFFWLKANFLPIAISQTKDNASGVHSCYMLKAIDNKRRTQYILNSAKLHATFHFIVALQQGYILANDKLAIITNNIHKLMCFLSSYPNELLNLTSNNCFKLGNTICAFLWQNLDKNKQTVSNINKYNYLSLTYNHHVKYIMDAISYHHHSITHALPELFVFCLYFVYTKKKLSSLNIIYIKTILNLVCKLEEQNFNNIFSLKVQLNKDESQHIRQIISKLLQEI